MGTFSVKNRSRKLWSVVEGRRVNQSSAAGVVRESVCVCVCVCVISKEHGDLSHVSILSMFTAPHTCKLVCTTVHWEGHYCLHCLMEWYPIVFFKLAVSYSIIFCVEILCVYTNICIHLLLSRQLNFQQPLRYFCCWKFCNYRNNLHFKINSNMKTF